MEDPETYLHSLTASFASVRAGSPLPVARFSVEAVANAFVVLGLLPAARTEQILVAQRPVLEAAGFRVGVEIGELSVRPDAGSFQEARAASPGRLRGIPLAGAAGPVRVRLRSLDLTITWVTLTPEGIWLRYHGDARDSDSDRARAYGEEVTEGITELSVTDDSGGTYLVAADRMHGIVSGRRSGSGEVRWIPHGEFLAVPAAGEAGSGPGQQIVRWLEFSAGSGQPVRIDIPSPATVPTGTSEPPWPTPAECYLAELAPPASDWSIGSFETGTVELDTAGIVAAVAGALLAVGALPADSAVLTGIQDRVRADWRRALSDRQLALLDTPAGPEPVSRARLAVRLPFEQATAVIENIAVREDLVSVQLYGYPWVMDDWPAITPCFRVTAVDDTGVEYEGWPATAASRPRTRAAAPSGSGPRWPRGQDSSGLTSAPSGQPPGPSSTFPAADLAKRVYVNFVGNRVGLRVRLVRRLVSGCAV